MFDDPWLQMHFRFAQLLSEQAVRQAPHFAGWDPDWETKREALIAQMSPEEQAWTREMDAKLEEKRRRRGFIQWKWRLN